MFQIYGCIGGQKKDVCEKLQAHIHFVSLIISIVFLLFTLTVHLAEDSLRYHRMQMKIDENETNKVLAPTGAQEILMFVRMFVCFKFV